MTSDKDSAFAVLAIDDISRPVIRYPPIAASFEKLVVLNSATEKKRCIGCIEVTLRCIKTLFKLTVVTHSPASFINRQTADIIVKYVPSALILDEQDCPIDTVHVDYNQRRIELFGVLVVDVSSLGWNLKSAKFLVSDNRTRCLLGLYLQFQLGVRTMQVGPSSPLVGII